MAPNTSSFWLLTSGYWLLLMAVPSRSPVGCAGKDAIGMLRLVCPGHDQPRDLGGLVAGKQGSGNSHCIWNKGGSKKDKLGGSEDQSSAR